MCGDLRTEEEIHASLEDFKVKRKKEIDNIKPLSRIVYKIMKPGINYQSKKDQE